jgi:predicted AlkP superfamily pyrophosphatase or phosphodiesterase
MPRPALALVLALAAACSGPPRAAAPGGRAADHVVLISVDGLAAYYLDDPKAPMPAIRGLAAEGARAQGMVGSFPTVTWPNHTTLVTGVECARHGVFGNSYFDRTKLEVVRFLPDPLFDKDEIVRSPTIYDAAHRAGLKTAGIIWPASRNAKTLDWTVPDCGTKELWDRYGTPSWMEELRREGIPVDMQETWCKTGGGVQRDWMYARMTAQVIRRHRPNLVLLHLVEADHVQHAKGPRTPDAYWAASYVDDRVRDVLEALEAAGIRGRTAVFVVSDHGFIGYTKTVNPNVRLKKDGLIRMEGEKMAARQAYVVAQGGGAFVYVLDPARRAELVATLKSTLGGLEGVAAALDEGEFGRIGFAPPAGDPRLPDLVLSAKDGYSFSDKIAGDAVVEEGPLKGSHGYLPDEPQMRATLVAAGAGIRRGARLGLVRSVDVAPTIARLLGLALDGADGRVLAEMLR